MRAPQHCHFAVEAFAQGNPMSKDPREQAKAERTIRILYITTVVMIAVPVLLFVIVHFR